MKKLLPLLMIVSVLVIACNNKSATDNNGKVLTYVDTTGLADFQKWRTENERKDALEYNSTPASIPVQKKSIAPAKKASMNSTGQYQAKAAPKKGWSAKAKGAAIGGGGGAIVGALINKNSRVKGGIVGGLLGAGLGYVIGNEIDRKHGR